MANSLPHPATLIHAKRLHQESGFSRSRLMSMDAYRGFVMLLMAGELLRFSAIHDALPTNTFWAFLAYQQTHVDWAGCSLHDLIQPSFSFLVGVALPYSMASRIKRGDSVRSQFGHALRRSLILALLGIFLRSIHSTQTNFTFEDTLTQIGLGYPFLFLLGTTTPRTQWFALAGILVGYWLAFVFYPTATATFNYAAVGVPANWTHHYTGLAAHFNKNSNLAWAFDTWFLNLFPRPTPFLFNKGGYATLSFIPTLGTMLLGLQAGQWLRSEQPDRTIIRQLLIAGASSLALGLALHLTGICPIVKRIWTPAWMLFSGGCCFAFMAFFYAIIDMAKRRSWAFFLTVIGLNSIAIYCLVELISPFVTNSFYIHLGHGPFLVFGPAFDPLLAGAATLGTLYLILLWMYRRKLFIRI